jgi:hypothetical protein
MTSLFDSQKFRKGLNLGREILVHISGPERGH